MKYSKDAATQAINLTFNPNAGYFAYQKAELSDGGEIVALDSSALKYQEIRKAAGLLGKNFSFVDYGCCHGLFGILLNQEFEGVSGTLVNVDKGELAICNKVVQILDTKNIKVVSSGMMDYNDQADLTLYMSLVHHILARGFSPSAIAQQIIKQTNKIAVVEVPSSKNDVLAEKVLADNRFKLDQVIAELKAKLSLVSENELHYNREISRTCFIFKK